MCLYVIIVAQSLNCIWLFVTRWTAGFLSFSISHRVLMFMSIESIESDDAIYLFISQSLLTAV